MANAVKAIPDGFSTITSYFTVSDAERYLEFLMKAFGAKVNFRSNGPDGRLMHGEVQIGTSKLMLGQAREPWKPMPCNIYMYVEDCDSVYQSAVAAGAKSIMEPTDQFYGDRHGGVTDAEGTNWWIATHIEDVPEAEIEKRAKAARH